MMKIIRVSVGLVLLSFCVVALSCKKPASRGGWAIGNSQRATLADYKGKVVVLDFYATWCEPCRDETPHLVQLQKQYEQKGLQVIGLNVGGIDDREKVPTYAKEFGVQYPLGFPDDEFADQYLSDNQNIPQSFVFDRSGKLVRRFVGYSESAGAELDRVVQASLAGQ
jgi:thiol-disulfide isomerase/thioredoxin